MPQKPRIRVRAWSRPITAEVLQLPPGPHDWVPPEVVLEDALEAELVEVVIIGMTLDGVRHYWASGDRAESLLLVMQAQHMLVTAADPPMPAFSEEGGEIIPFRGRDH